MLIKLLELFSHIPVGGFSIGLAVLGAIVSILGLKGWKRWTLVAVFLLLGAGEWAVLIRNDNAARAADEQRIQKENAKQQKEEAFEAKIENELTQIINSPNSQEQKQVAILIKKELLYDPSNLHRVSTSQLKDAEAKLSAEMIDLENQQDKKSEEIMLSLRGVSDPLDIQKQMLAAYNNRTSDFRKNYLNRASAVRDELLFRLRKTPEQSEKEVSSTLPPLVQEMHGPANPISRALGGELAGPHPISDAAMYLDGLARLLQ